MKKRLVLMAMAGVALAGCVNDEVADISQKQEQAKATKIVFESPVMYDNGNDSRASVFGEIGPHTAANGVAYTYPKEEDFRIFAIQYSGDFPGWEGTTGVPVADPGFNGSVLEYDNDVDGWAPKAGGRYYYWPDGKKMAFAAYSPGDLTVADVKNASDELINEGVTPTYGKNGLKIENFQVMPDAAKQYDLMFSARVVDQTAEKMAHGADYYSGIPIKFQHALSSIRFSLQNTSGTPVVIKKIELYGIKDIGTFNENIDENGGTYDRTPSTGNVEPEWEDLTLSDPSLRYHVFTGAVTAPYEAQYLSVLLDATDPSYNPENAGDFNQLLVLPQAVTDAKVYIEYTIDGVFNTKSVDLKDAFKVSATNGNDVTDEKLSAWEIGHRYTYRLWYSDESADKDRIYFSPSSDDWADAGAYKIEL